LWALITLLPLSSASAAAPSFERDVWPILKENCYGCHSAVEKKAKGGLSFDTRADFLKGGEDGPIFIAGKPGDSPIIKMISGAKPEMPKKQPPLASDEVKLLSDWVAAGATIDTWPSISERKVVIPAVYRFAPAVSSLSFSPDGQMLAAACRSEIVLIPAGAKDEAAANRRLPTDCEQITHVEFSPDGKLLASVGGSPSRFGEVCFFRPDTGEVAASRRLTRDTLFGGNFAPDGKTIAVGGSDGAVHFVPVDPALPDRAAELHSDWVMSVAYSPDGKLIVTGGRDKAAKVAAADSGKLLTTLDMSAEMMMGVGSDQQFAVSVNRRGDLVSYEYKIALAGVQVGGSGNGATPVRGQFTKSFEAQGPDVLALASSADRKLLAVATSTGEVRVYRIADRARAATVTKVPGPVFSLALDADGKRVAVGTKAGLVLLYDVGAATGKLIKSLTPVPVQDAAAITR
jgi:WD40 repeat protein